MSKRLWKPVDTEDLIDRAKDFRNQAQIPADR